MRNDAAKPNGNDASAVRDASLLRLGVRALTADGSWQRAASVVGVEVELIRGEP